MSQTLIFTPPLSSAFERARKLSRVMAVFFAIGFGVMLVVMVWMSVDVIFIHSPNRGLGLAHGIRVNWDQMQGWRRVGALTAADLVLIPTIMILHHAHRLFSCFARGEVFAAKPIAHMRAAGLWLTASFLTGIAALYLLQLCGADNLLFGHNFHFPGALVGLSIEMQSTLIIGIATLIAAYVMEEARRIAADHAEIV